MSGPKAWVIWSIHGKKRCGSRSPARSEMLVIDGIVDMVVMMMVMVVVMVMIVVVIVMVVVVSLEEIRVEGEDAVEIEGTAVEDLVDRNGAALGPVDHRMRVDRADAPLDFGELVRRDEVGLVEEDHVGEADLLLGLGRVTEALDQVLGVGDRDHRVELRPRLHLVVHEEGLGDRRRVGEAGGLDEDAIEPAGTLHQPLDDADQVAAHRAADAAIVHFVDLLVGFDDEVVVDADLAEFVDHHGIALAVVLREDAIEERGLAGAEIAGEHRDGDLGGCHGNSAAARPPISAWEWRRI